MITAIAGAVALIVSLVAGFIGHWLGTRKTDAAVAQAKTATEATTRAAVATETATAAGQAQTDAAAIRVAAVNEASASADKGKDALIAQMRADGEIQP
jgi:guanyl-specific ribonuclease Sa